MANYALASYLADAGSEVHLVANHADSTIASRHGVTFHRIPRPVGSYYLSTPILDRVGRWWGARAASRGGRTIVNGGNCLWGDANWVHYVHAAYRPEVATGRLAQARWSIERRSFLATERRALERARVVIANSNRTKQHLVSLLAVPPSLVHTVYYGTDTARFGEVTLAERETARTALGWAGERPIVVFVGALGDRRKGFDVLFDAWARLCATSSWDAQLAVIGSGGELPRWRERARQAGMGNRIHFLGFTDRVSEILAACDVMAHPARYEAYGLGVHEALSRGLPAIVSAHAGVAERYPAELQDLLLHDPDSSTELQERLLAWRQDIPRFREGVARWSPQLRARSWAAMAAEITTILAAT